MDNRKFTPMELKEIRRKLGISQKVLYKFFGLSDKTRISEYERGVRNPSSGIIKLYELLRDGKINPPK